MPPIAVVVHPDDYIADFLGARSGRLIDHTAAMILSRRGGGLIKCHPSTALRGPLANETETDPVIVVTPIVSWEASGGW